VAPNSESGGNAEPLGVRRQIELPEVNTEAGDVAPNADTRPKTVADRPETGSATVHTGESRPEGATASSEKEEQHALATGVTVPGPPAGPRFATVTRLLLKNLMTGLCADIPGHGDGDLQGPVQQFTCNGSSRDNQQWDLVVNDKGGGPGGADLFTIRNTKDDHCVDLPGNGAVDHGRGKGRRAHPLAVQFQGRPPVVLPLSAHAVSGVLVPSDLYV
jgi:hypothetical protein